MQIADSIRRMTAPHWLGFFALILGGWILLYAMQLPPDLLAARDIYGADFWLALCSVEPGWPGAPKLFLMWSAMAAAMMAPTLLPALATYDDIAQNDSVQGGFGRLVAGYLVIWLGFAAVATALQVTFAQAGLLDPEGVSVNRWLTAGLLALAGAYQFSNIKDVCLSKCRRAFVFFMQFWAEGPFRMGLRLGALCLGCCWALMALAFVGGTMNLLWMGAAMLLMILEKLPEIGRHLTRPVGFALLGASVVAAFV
jgi:predicted metal-binding membrane protein